MDGIIANYLSAFERANRRSFEDNIVYRNGWFVFEQEIGDRTVVQSRHRKSDILAMTNRLNERCILQKAGEL